MTQEFANLSSGLSQYQQALMLARRNSLVRMNELEQQVRNHLRVAYNDLIQRILLLDAQDPDVPLIRFQLQERAARIRSLLLELGNTLSETLRENVYTTAQQVSQIRQDATRTFAETSLSTIRATQPGVPLVIPRIDFSEVPLEVMGVYAQRADTYGLKLSPRKWAAGVEDAIVREINAALASGKSARNLSVTLKQFLLGAQGLDAEELEMFSTSTFLPRKIRLSLDAHARMTARTEINHAYWEASQRSARLSPVVNALKWNLSASHKSRSGRAGWDQCDLFAGTNLYDLGDGIYPPEKFPIPPHPNCLCYSTDVLREPSEWNIPKLRGTYQDQIALASLPTNAYNLIRGQYVGKTHAPRVEILQVLESALSVDRHALGSGITSQYLRSQINGFQTLSHEAFSSNLSASSS